jgi:pentatricopeptide repeat protein
MLEEIKKIITVYIETSVISGYGRERFHEYLLEFFDLIRQRKIKPEISTHTIDELADKRTPKRVIDNLYTINFIPSATTEEMKRLGDLYVEKGIEEIITWVKRLS